MQLFDEMVREQVQSLETPIKVNQTLAQRMMHLIDMTSLNATDTESSIAMVCEKAKTKWGYPAAVCFYPQFVQLAAAQFAGTSVKVDTVANFPEGDRSLEEVLIEINQALSAGAQEVDVVFPYARYMLGERKYACTFIAACKAACGESVKLKVILETGMLRDLALIAEASNDVLHAGADFLKTSTGKREEGATLEAAATMLFVIRELTPQLKRPLGLKVSGGIRTIEQAARYMELADRIMGHEWVNANTFRIGASKLVDELIALPG